MRKNRHQKHGDTGINKKRGQPLTQSKQSASIRPSSLPSSNDHPVFRFQPWDLIDLQLIGPRIVVQLNTAPRTQQLVHRLDSPWRKRNLLFHLIPPLHYTIFSLNYTHKIYYYKPINQKKPRTVAKRTRLCSEWPPKDLYSASGEALHIVSKHGHRIWDVIVLVLAHHRIAAQLSNELPIFLVILNHG